MTTFAICYLEEQYRKLDPSYTGSSLEADVAKAESAIRASERERIHGLLINAMQDDLENGVKWLNENAAKEFFNKFPALNKAIRELGDD